MDSGKVDNQLSLALDMTEEERQRTLDLEVGFEPEEKRWELIVKYVGSLDRVREELSARVTTLMNGYAVLTVPESQIEKLASYEEIIFIEKPKRLFFAVNQGKAVSCIVPVTRPPFSLTGKGVLVGLIDSGDGVIVLLFPIVKIESSKMLESCCQICYSVDIKGATAHKVVSLPVVISLPVLAKLTR